MKKRRNTMTAKLTPIETLFYCISLELAKGAGEQLDEPGKIGAVAQPKTAYLYKGGGVEEWATLFDFGIFYHRILDPLDEENVDTWLIRKDPQGSCWLVQYDGTLEPTPIPWVLEKALEGVPFKVFAARE